MAEKAKAKYETLGTHPLDDYANHEKELIALYKDLMGVHKKSLKKIKYRDKLGNIREEDIKGLVGSDVDAVARTIGKFQAISNKYESLAQKILGEYGPKSVKGEGDLEKYLRDIAREVSHDQLLSASTKEDFYGMLLHQGKYMNMSEEDIKVLWKKAQEDNEEGKDARKRLISLIVGSKNSVETQAHIAGSMKHVDDAFGTPEYKSKLKSYAIAAAIGMMALSHGQYTPDLESLMESPEAISKELQQISSHYIHKANEGIDRERRTHLPIKKEEKKKK